MDGRWSPQGRRSVFSNECDFHWPSFVQHEFNEDPTNEPSVRPFTHLDKIHETSSMQRYLNSKEQSNVLNTPLQLSQHIPHRQAESSIPRQSYHDHTLHLEKYSGHPPSGGNHDGDRPSSDHNPSLCSDHSILSPRMSEDRLDFDQPFPRQYYYPPLTYTSGYPSGYNASYPTGFDLNRSFGDYSPSFHPDSAYHSPRSGGVALRDLQQQSDFDDEDRVERDYPQGKKRLPDSSSSPNGSRLFPPLPQTFEKAEEALRRPSVNEDIDPNIATGNINQSDDSDYHPNKKAKRTHTRRSSNSSAHTRNTTHNRTNRSRVPSKSSKTSPPQPNTDRPLSRSPTHPCPHCPHLSPTPSSHQKHLLTHTRPYRCIFFHYGCTSTFSSKNEWKRHINTQHLRLGVYRCDMGGCAPSSQRRRGGRYANGDEECSYNEFNRKDLFVQHLRRMHSPSLTGESKSEASNGTIEQALQRCWREIRKPPMTCTCGICRRKGVLMVFEGNTAWDSWLEHVGAHLKDAGREQAVGVGERGFLDDDEEMRVWFVNEGLLVWKVGTGWRIVGGRGGRVKEEEVDGDADAEGEDE